MGEASAGGLPRLESKKNSGEDLLHASRFAAQLLQPPGGGGGGGEQG